MDKNSRFRRPDFLDAPITIIQVFIDSAAPTTQSSVSKMSTHGPITAHSPTRHRTFTEHSQRFISSDGLQRRPDFVGAPITIIPVFIDSAAPTTQSSVSKMSTQKPFTAHSPTHHRPFTAHSPTRHRTFTAHSQRTHRALTDVSQRTQRRITDLSQRTHRPVTGHSQHIHSALTDLSQRNHRPFTERSQRTHLRIRDTHL